MAKMKLISKELLDGIPNVEALIAHILQLVVTDTNKIRKISVSDDEATLTITQDGAGINFDISHATEPEVRITERDQTDPAGRYRVRGTAGSLIFEKALTASWATSAGFFYVDVGNKLLRLYSAAIADDWETRLEASGVFIQLLGKTHASPATVKLWTRNAADNGNLQRLGIDGKVTQATATWTNIKHTGFLAADMALKIISELTIAGGVVTKTGSFHTIDTASDDPTDDLDTINGDSQGDLLVIRAAHTDRTIVVKHGTGNIQLRGAADISLDNTEKALLLISDGTNWMDL